MPGARKSRSQLVSIDSGGWPETTHIWYLSTLPEVQSKLGEVFARSSHHREVVDQTIGKRKISSYLHPCSYDGGV